MNIVKLIRSEKPNDPNWSEQQLAVVEGSRTVTYAHLFERIDTLAQALTAQGVQAGWRVAFHCPDGIDYITGSLAILQAGGAVVPLPDALTHEEIAEIIERMDVQAVLRHHEKPAGDISLSGVMLDEIFHWHTRQATGELDSRCVHLNAAFVRFSSGTTGQSKGVLLSHESIADRTAAANEGLQVTCRDTILWVLGMSHHFVVSILLFLRQRATIIVGHKQFPFSIMQAANDHAITLIYGSPVHYYLLGVSDAIAPEALAGVRLAVSTAMKLPAATGEAFKQKFGIEVAEAYGIIEIGLPFIHGSKDDDTLGKPLPAYELRIDSPDSHGVGDVLIRGKGMFDAYLWPWRTREVATDQGWFATGDLGRLDEQGRLKLLGRSKTVIICAGMKVFPEEVEAIINTHASVHASRVRGQEHPQFGQVPIAEVELLASISSDEEKVRQVIQELRSHCMNHLTSYKVPVMYKAVDKLLRTPSGKVARHD